MHVCMWLQVRVHIKSFWGDVYGLIRFDVGENKKISLVAA